MHSNAEQLRPNTFELRMADIATMYYSEHSSECILQCVMLCHMLDVMPLLDTDSILKASTVQLRSMGSAAAVSTHSFHLRCCYLHLAMMAIQPLYALLFACFW